MELDALLDQARVSTASGFAAVGASQPQGVMTHDQVVERAALEADQAAREFTSRVANGYLILQEQYRRLNGAPGHERAIPFLEPGFFESREAEIAASAAEEAQDLDLADALGIALDDLSAAHDLTEELFGQQRYEDAAAALFCLTLIAPEVPELHRTLGHAEYYCGRLENATRCYYQSYLCDPRDPEPLFNAAYCLAAAGDPAAAEEFRRKAQELEKEVSR